MGNVSHHFLINLLLILVGLYIASNAWLSFLREESALRLKGLKIILFFDIILISVIIYFLKGFETDLYLVYFLIIFVAAMQHGGVQRSWITGLLAAGLYLGLYLRTNPLESVLSSYVLLRIPFFFLMAVFSAYHSERLRKEAQRRLRAEEATERLYMQYKTLVDTIPDIIFEIDADGLFTFVSESVREFGYDPRELLGHHFAVLLFPEDLESCSRKIVLERYKGLVTGDENAPKLFDERRTKKRMTRNLLLRMRVRGASSQAADAEPYVFVEMHSSGKWERDPAIGSLRLVGSIGVIRDVTDNIRSKKAVEAANLELQRINRELEQSLAEVKKSHDDLKRTQAQLLQSEKLASIGQLAAGIAHEINNPLGFLSSNISFLIKDIETLKSIVETAEDVRLALERCDHDALESGAARIVQTVKELDPAFFLEDADRLIKGTSLGVERIKKIISDLMSFSRKDDGERTACNLNELIESVLNFVWNEIKYKAELRKEFSDLPLIKINPQQISQVILNLILNAVQAIEGGGIITIRTSCRDGGISIAVQDNGRGIPESIRSTIFEPFFTTKKAGQGTGLGLSISLDIVKKHGGRIDVSSREGEGACFDVWLPLQEKGD